MILTVFYFYSVISIGAIIGTYLNYKSGEHRGAVDHCDWVWSSFNLMKQSLQIPDQGGPVYFLLKHLFGILFHAMFFCGIGPVLIIAFIGDVFCGLRDIYKTHNAKI